MEGEKQPTPEEIAEIEKSRTINDAELLENGAVYGISEDGKKGLHLSDRQNIEVHERNENLDFMNEYCNKEFFEKMRKAVRLLIVDNTNFSEELRKGTDSALDQVFGRLTQSNVLETAIKDYKDGIA